MPISLACACGKKLTVPDQAAGKKGKCPACGAVVQVPPAQTLAPPISPPPEIQPPVQSLQYATPGQVVHGAIAPPPSVLVPMPSSINPKFTNPAAPPCYLVMSADGADVNADFDVSPVTQSFADNFAKKLKKKYNVTIAPPPDPNDFAVYVRILRIEQGNRLLRYLFGLFAGHTIFQVVATATTTTGQPLQLRAKHRTGLAVFGGSSLGLLKLNAKIAGARIGKQALRAR